MKRILLSCLIMLHSPDGTGLLIGTNEIVVREIDPKHQDHVAKGTNSVVYTNTKQNGMGVKETLKEVTGLIDKCRESN